MSSNRKRRKGPLARWPRRVMAAGVLWGVTTALPAAEPWGLDDPRVQPTENWSDQWPADHVVNQNEDPRGVPDSRVRPTEDWDYQWPASRAASQIEAPRSLDDTRDRPNENWHFQWPGDRYTTAGPQIHYGPFVVLCATPAIDPEMVRAQIEQASQAYIDLARNWSPHPGVHFQQIDQLAVLVQAADQLERDPGPGVYKDFDGTLHLVLAGEGLEDARLASELRTAAVEHLLTVTGENANLSRQTSHQVAQFIASREVDRFDPFAPSEDSVAALRARDESEAVETFRFYWESDDASRAPEVIEALRAALGEGDPRYLERLLRARELPVVRAEWQADPLAGQPRVALSVEMPPELVVREREMALVLKLARRFPATIPGRVQPRVTGFEEGKMVELPISETPPPQRSIEDLYRQLTAASDWATLDIDGSVLFGSDQTRLAELFALAENRYELVTRDGQEVLVTTLGPSARLEATLQDDDDYPRRPLARFALVENE